jgi:putative Mg2+ transporter-C (MgtC) family protein
MQQEYFDIVKISIAFAAGSLLGLEREYRSKPAGFRTMILICIGSCLFTILSLKITNNPDRIAANIITGIGFIGAGVIFKEGIGIRGITSAATIFIAAAIGMCIGFGYFVLASFVTVLVLAVLIVLSKLEEVFDNFRQTKEYTIRINGNNYSVNALEHDLEKMDIHFMRYKVLKNADEIIASYKIETKVQHHEKLSQFLLNNKHIIGFDL